jgi:DNA-binding HxlR family transcriptional regulator
MTQRQLSQSKPLCTETLKMIGDYWTLTIVKAIGAHKRRFCELERLLPDSNPVTLTNRLKKMESLGLLTRTKIIADKIPVMYALTKQGRALLPIAVRIEKFAETFN